MFACNLSTSCLTLRCSGNRPYWSKLILSSRELYSKGYAYEKKNLANQLASSLISLPWNTMLAGFFSSSLLPAAAGRRSSRFFAAPVVGADLNLPSLLGEGKSMKASLCFFFSLTLMSGLATFVRSGYACGGLETA